MKTEHRFYEVFPSVVKAGEKTKISIKPTHKRYEFKESEYVVKIVPKEIKDYKKDLSYHINDVKPTKLTVDVKDGEIVFEYDFLYEQEYSVILDKLNLDFRIYALSDDLYGTMPYKGDLHLHTQYSDGLSTADEAVSAYRENGYDFICMTEHHKYQPSVVTKEKYDKIKSGLTIFPGEEVHNMGGGYFHIVNFNGSYSVNEIIESDYAGVQKQVLELSEKLDIPDGIDRTEFAFRKWICDEIRKSGGKAIFPHPYWVFYSEYQSTTPLSFAALKSGMYDIYEIIGGCTSTGNQLQVGVYNELRAEGYDIPIVGSSDGHDHSHTNGHFGSQYTIVFAKEADGITDAIMDGKSVAVEAYPNQFPRAFGKFRLIKYALFLIENFYPVYCQYTKDLGALMRRYADFGDCIKSIEALNQQAQNFKNKYFGIN